MAREQWENDLLKELEGLDYLNKLFQGFDNLLEEAVDEYGSELDPNLVILLEAIRYDVNVTLSGVVKLADGTNVDGIIKQYADVQDEVIQLGAGVKPKRGVTDEDVEEE